MKKFFLALLTVALVLCAGSIAWAIVEGTPHDVNVMQDTTGLEICAMCHTPHQGPTEDRYPLWNRTDPGDSYTLYSSPTFDMTPGPGALLREPSTLCMACHNGSISQLVNYPGPGSNEDTDYNFNSSFLQSGWSDLSGMSLTNDHPISFDYDPALDDATDNNGFPAAISVGIYGRKMVPGTGANYPLYGASQDWFECSTCHAVHHTAVYSGPAMAGGISAGTQVYFLRTDNASSRMCTDCHTNR